MKVCFETFGCRLSRAEALEQEAEFLERGWQLTEKHSDADLIIVRGCSVTRRAQHDSERLVEHIKSKYPMTRLVVTGCLPKKTSPFLLKPREDGRPAPVPNRTSRAYLKVQDGCSGKCTFCIVPSFRGSSVSADFDTVVDKARRFVDAGYREIVVTGCNLSLYASQGKRLGALLAALADIAPPSAGADATCRIRLGSLEPSPAVDEVLDAMSEKPNICRFLHIPIQSGSSRILVAMKRPYTARSIDELVHKARTKIPGVEFGCDIMTGFPGEFDIDFIATKGMISRIRPSRVHVFPYSERPGTIAERLQDSVPKDIRKSRAQEIANQAGRIRSECARKYIGTTVEFVVEDEKPCAGWTSEYFWCVCKNSRARRKSLVRATVRETDGHVLLGEVC